MLGTIPPEAREVFANAYVHLSGTPLASSLFSGKFEDLVEQIPISTTTAIQIWFEYSDKLSGTVPAILGTLTHLSVLKVALTKVSGK